LAKEISLDSITPREKTLLINAIMPAKPMDPGESRRLGTFALLLWLTAQNHGPIDEYDVFAAAREPPGNIPSVFRTVLDGWLDYTIRDVIAATHEAVFEAVMREVDAASARRGAPALAAEVVSAIVGATDDHNDALRQTGLLTKGETVRRLSFSQMLERIDGACGTT
jgi:hypothetical protein